MNIKRIALSLLIMMTTYALKGQDQKLHQLFERYHDDEMRLYPVSATFAGDHRFDDQLELDGAAPVIAARKRFFLKYQQELKSFDPSALNDIDRISYRVMQHNINNGLRAIELHLEYIPMTQFVSTPLDMAQWGSGSGMHPFKTVKDYDNWAKRMIAFEAWTDTAIVNFNSGIKASVVLPKALVVKMIPQMEELSKTDIFYQPLSKFPSVFSAADKKRLTALYKKIIESKMIPSYKKLTVYLRETYLPVAQDHAGLSALPDGDKLYDYYFQKFTTSTALTPEQLYQTGLAEVTRISKEMESIKTKVGFNGSLQEFFHYLRTDKRFMPFKTPEEVLDAYRAIHERVKPHLGELFGLQPKTAFEIRRVEAFREASQGGPSYVTGNLEEDRPGIFYVPVRDASRVNVTFYGMEATFLHEAVPGHHYQIALQQENKEIPAFRKQLSFSVFSEGWALYTESLGEQMGCYADPYQKMGALNNEIHRAIRLVTDIALHTGKMTREEAIKYMMEHESIDEVIATAETERYMAMPGQALSYKTGELKIKELRAKYEKQLSLKEFHDALLSKGDMPLSVLEEYMDRWSGK